ncbi:MAG: ABC transporter substrate-binding protein [Actinomycetota bacterium]|nr:ABC transporter substrate-binding protein [Actinomycetota bacterium]
MAALLAFALVAAACGDSDDGAAETTAAPAATTEAPQATTTAAPATTAAPTTTTAADPGKQYGGEVTVADDQEPPTLNWAVPGGDNAVVSRIGQAYWAGVQEIDGFTLELIPELVTELPTVANGGVVVNEDLTMTVNYQIRDEAIWSDGTPISGDDFQFTYEIIMDPDLATNKAIYEDIISTDFGPKTFTYTLAQPTVQFDLLFGTLIPKHDVEGSDFTTDWNETMWASAGPYVFDSWQKGEFIKVVRNENYWKFDPETGDQLPYLDSVVMRFIPETESIINAFKAREVDVIQPPPATETIEVLQALEPEGAIVEVLTGPVWEHLNFQFGPGRLERNPDSTNENLNYRKGVAHTINKDLIVDEILAGQVEPLTSFLEPGVPQIATGAWKQYDYNVDTAKAYFEDAKAELGVDELFTVFSTTSNNDARVKLSELFVNMFEDVGVTYENQLEDSQLFFGETLDNGLWDFGEWAWLGTPGFSGGISLFDLFDPELPPPDGQNVYRWGSPDSVVIDENTVRFAEIRDELNASVDEAVLVPLMQEGEQILADQVVIIPLYARLVTAAVWGDEVGGYKHNPSQASDLWNMEDWYRLDL